MKRIIKSIVICFTFIISFILINNNVYAATANIGGGSYIPTPLPSSGGYGYASFSTIPVAFGYRVSVVDKKGNFAPNTHSHDYWSDWGRKYGMSNNEKVGLTYLKYQLKNGYTYANNWKYYSEPRPKTQSKTSVNTTNYLGDFNKHTGYWQYASAEEFIDKKSFSFSVYCDNSTNYFSKDYLTSGGCGGGGDSRIGNNYARLALETFQEEIKKENYTFIYTILRDCGFSGNDNKVANDARQYYLIVEPLSALYATSGVTLNSIVIGTPSDLKAMGVYSNYNEFVYNNYMYLNPVIFNTLSGPLKACTKAEVSNYRMSESTSSVANSTGCVGAFTMYIGDIVKGSCDENAKKITNKYFTSSNNYSVNNDTYQKYLKELYEDELTKQCVSKNGSTYTLNDKCNALDPVSIKSNKGVTTSDACSTIKCSDQLKGATKNYSGNDLATIANTLYEYWKSRGNTYLLLKKEMYDLLNNGVPNCGTKEIKCDPEVGSIGNCDANVTFKDSTLKECWSQGIAYNNVNDLLDVNSYQSAKDATLSDSSCQTYCVETVTFDLPKDQTDNLYGTNSGRVFKWGKNVDTTDPLFGNMTITRECKSINTSGAACNINKKVAYWVNDVDTQIELNYYESVSKRTISSTPLDTKLDSYKVEANGKVANNVNNTVKTDHSKVTAYYSFNYGKSFHWYADNSQNDKYVSESEISNTSNTKYLEIGYGIPTDFASPTKTITIWKNGDYDWSKTTGKSLGYMYATIRNIGTKNNDGSHHFDKLIKTNKTKVGFDSDGSLKYSCNYSIKNKLFGTECVGSDNDPDYCSPDTEPEGIDVVFRTIELINTSNANVTEEINKAFPGKNGLGRKIGSNWNELITSDSKEIYNILRNTVYEEDPLYEITLNVSTIQKIRNYNSTARKKSDPYTYMGDDDGKDSNGYLGYKCSKTKGEYAYCASELLSKLKQDNNLSGKCLETYTDTLTRATKYDGKTCN